MYYITMLSGDYVLLDGKSIRSSLEPLLRIIYSLDSDANELVEFHISTDEVSIIIPTRYTKYFNGEFYTEPYKALKVETDNPGLEEPGILAGVTGIFKQYEIPILSVSTYSYNYIFVPSVNSSTVSQIASENENIELEN